MKKKFAALLSCGLLLTLCACGAQKELVGTWENDGTWERQGEKLSFENADTLTFREDETGTMKVTTAQGTNSEVEFTYSASDGTLTLTAGDVRAEWGYALDGDALTIELEDGASGVFVKAK